MSTDPYTPLLELADRYCDHVGLSHWRVSFLILNKGQFFNDLRKGAGCTLRTSDKVTAWFAANWPADLEWPRDIPRPKKREAA
jgi:hypothetical protein